MAEIESGSASQVNTPSRISGVSSGSKLFFSRGHNTSESPEYHDAYNFSATESSAASRYKDTGGRELWGWCLYDLAASAYTYGVTTVFYPLLIYWLATNAAVSQQADDLWMPRCTSDGSVNCAACVPGEGYIFRSADGTRSGVPSVRVGLGATFDLSPYSVVAVILGVVLVLQLLTFITLSPLIDYGRWKKALLAVATGVGVTAVMLSINLYTAKLWWTAAILFIVSDVAFGQAMVAYNSFLLPLTKALPRLKRSLMVGTSTRDQERTRLEVVNGVSLTGLGLGNLGGFASMAVAYGSVAFVPGVTDTFAFRTALSVAGLWWAVWTFPACVWLPSCKRPGFPDSVFHLGLGWHNLWLLRTDLTKVKYAVWVLVAVLVATNGSTALFQASVLYGREKLCMSTRQTVVVALVVCLSSALGCPAFAFFQRTTWLDNTVVIANLLTVMSLTACYAVLGFVTSHDSVGLHHKWEVYAIAACQGFCVGSLTSFTRTLFLDCIQESHQGLMFSLYGLVRQTGVWLGYLAVSFFVQASSDFRYAFVYAAAMLLLPAILLLVSVDHQQGMIDAGHIIYRDSSDVVSAASPDIRDYSYRVRDLSSVEHVIRH